VPSDAYQQGVRYQVLERLQVGSMCCHSVMWLHGYFACGSIIHLHESSVSCCSLSHLAKVGLAMRLAAYLPELTMPYLLWYLHSWRCLSYLKTAVMRHGRPNWNVAQADHTDKPHSQHWDSLLLTTGLAELLPIILARSFIEKLFWPRTQNAVERACCQASQCASGQTHLQQS